MFAAARDPRRNHTWIDTMIVIQVLDWIGTVGYLIVGDVTLRNVTSAAFLPPLFIAALLYWHPRRLPHTGNGSRLVEGDLVRG